MRWATIITSPTAFVRDVFWPERSVVNPRYELFRNSSPNADVVMVGDSITRQGLWTEAIPELTIANRGADGERVSDALGRLDKVTSAKAKFAFLMMGINDITCGRAVDDVLCVFERVFEGLKGAGIRTIVFATFECSETACGDSLNKMRRLNGGRRGIVARLQAPFIDLNDRLSGPAGLTETLTHDGIHLNAARYKIWVEKVRKFLRDDGKL